MVNETRRCDINICIMILLSFLTTGEGIEWEREKLSLLKAEKSNILEEDIRRFPQTVKLVFREREGENEKRDKEKERKKRDIKKARGTKIKDYMLCTHIKSCTYFVFVFHKFKSYVNHLRNACKKKRVRVFTKAIGALLARFQLWYIMLRHEYDCMICMLYLCNNKTR